MGRQNLWLGQREEVGKFSPPQKKQNNKTGLNFGK